MSQLLINDYLKQLALIHRASGSQRETIVREAFKDLLKAWGRQQGLVFLAEYPVKTATKTNIALDGALLHELHMPLGYWEAKDADDDRSFIESRTFDGFRKTVAAEFSDIYVVDLGGDVRANPKLSGTKHNVFGIQTGVAISFMVKRTQTTKDKRPARVH
jgi:hypothetical protein